MIPRVKSDKDGGGTADVEIKALTMIEDMGGGMDLSKPPSAEDRDACNTVQTSSGQAEFQQLTAAPPGGRNRHGSSERISDAHATRYAAAFSPFTEA